MAKRPRSRRLLDCIKSRTQEITSVVHVFFGQFSKYHSSTSEKSAKLDQPTIYIPTLDRPTLDPTPLGTSVPGATLFNSIKCFASSNIHKHGDKGIKTEWAQNTSGTSVKDQHGDFSNIGPKSASSQRSSSNMESYYAENAKAMTSSNDYSPVLIFDGAHSDDEAIMGNLQQSHSSNSSVDVIITDTVLSSCVSHVAKGLDTDIDDSDSEDDYSDGLDIGEGILSPIESPQFSGNSNYSNHSSASSTYEFDQEPFDTYNLKVIQLCHDIGFGEPSNVERMYGGDYNRVIGLTFSENSEDQHFVLRVPRHVLEESKAFTIRDQVATLLFLGQFDFLCAPTIVAIDTTTANVIESQYVLQKKLPGKPLQDVLFTLPLAEKLELVTVAAQLFIKMDCITLEDPGVLSGTQPLPWTSTSLPPSTLKPTVSGFDFNYSTVASPLKQQSLASLLSNLLNEQKKKYIRSPVMVLKWAKLLDIVEEMDQAGLFKDSDMINVLWHWDVCARHIFVDKYESSLASIITDMDSTSDITHPVNIGHFNSNFDKDKFNVTDDASETFTAQTGTTSSIWKVTGVIDWDDAKSVPRVLTRIPRTWLWFDEVERTDSWDGNRDCPPERALTEDELTIKRHFDQLMQQADPNYLNDTYFRGVWIRRLFRFAQSGIHNTADFVRYDKFVKDWETYFSGHILMTL
ncbi:hypothetical protein EYC80_004342 [Monilinia laxa]|uniref:Aminoglycoside phosphotransferase domain-containing protein n=1 Tax=Monilinia laxa TaxID=61186 RepID=A0A5N6KN31_MONLA|nr:hypothetical protein EYC80_004342 [Monilinia laxa]